MKNTKKWTIRYRSGDESRYVNVIGGDVLRVIEWVCAEYGISSVDIDYLSSEDVVIID